MERFFNYTGFGFEALHFRELEQFRAEFSRQNPHIRPDMISVYALPFCHTQHGPGSYRHFYEESSSRYWFFTADIHVHRMILGHFVIVVCIHHPLMVTHPTWV